MGFFQEFLLCAHLRPLEGGKGLGNEERCTGHNLHLPRSFFSGNRLKEKRGNFIGKLGDAADILFRLRGQAQHKIQLHSCPAAFKGHGCTLEDYLLRQAFIDNIPQSLASGFRREGQAAFFHILYLAHDIKGKSVDTQGRQ